MKSAKSLALTLLCLALFASASFAQNLILPRGLAVDSSGNLWVANAGGNNVLVYNSAYVLQTSKTISQGVIMPSAVAFDSAGNLWVANDSLNGGGAGNVTEYSGGKPTGTIITQGINHPLAMAIDGLNNLWVMNNYENVTVYGQTPAPWDPPTTLLQTFSGANSYTAVAAGGQVISLAFQYTGIENLQVVASSLVPAAFQYGQVYQSVLQGYYATAMAIGGYNLYYADSNGEVYLNQNFFFTETPTLLTTVSFYPTGMAVDIVRDRIYISDYNDNVIDVFNFKGKLIHTITSN